MLNRLVRALGAWAILFIAIECRAQAPTLSYLSPAAIQPGQSVDVTFYGANLSGPTGLWTSGAVKVELATAPPDNGQKADQVVYRLTLPKDAPLGVDGLRLATGKGISNARLLMIDDLPSVADNGNNHTQQSAQPINFGSAVDGACDAETSDLYKLNVAAGQRVSIEVVARRLGSVLDPVIRLLDGQGKELAYSDDEPGVSADCRMTHTFAAAGDYFIELRDIRYLGGGDYRYRLRVGDFPLVNAAFPLALARGADALVQPLGNNLANIAAVVVKSPSPSATDYFRATVAYPQPQPSLSADTKVAAAGSSWIDLLQSATADQLETEPNDRPDLSTACTLAAGISGRLQAAHDRDYYQFEAKAGQRMRLVGQTRRLGSPTDLFMRLYKPDGSLLTEVDDSGMDEGVLDATFPSDGVYRLMVEDVNRRGGSQHVYRIAPEPYRPGFSLVIENDKYDAPAAGTFAAKIISTRRDYNGPITISVEGAGDGWVLENNVIAEGKNETVLSATLPAVLQPGKPMSVGLVGRAKIGDQELVAVASTLAALRKGLGGLPYPPAELDGQVGLGIGPVFPDFFELVLEPAALTWNETSKPTMLKVKASRSGGFDDKIQLAIEGLPAGVAFQPAAIEKGQTEVAVELKPAAQAITPGTFKLRVSGAAAFQNQLKRRTSEVELIVAPAQ